MKITTIGRGSIGGTLARLWTAAGHEVTTLGRDGGDASDADVVLLAVRHADIPAALAGVSGLEGKVVIDTSNRLDGEPAHDGHASNAEFVKATLGGPTAKAFNLNFGKLLEGAAQAPNRPDNIWVGDEAARAAVEELTRDVGMQPRHAGPLDRAGAQEAFGLLLVAIVKDAGHGLLFYRFAAPEAI